VSGDSAFVMPPKATIDEAYHVSLSMKRAVLDGRGKELIDVAKVDLTR
jgi:pyruvate dehydrogenase (quinone)